MIDKNYLLNEAIEQLRCAEINCDNVEKIGVVMIKVVKMQIQLALNKLLEIGGN